MAGPMPASGAALLPMAGGGEEPGRARRLKWLFALMLCPACFLGFGWSLLGITAGGLGALLWRHRFVSAALLLVAVAAIALAIRSRRRRRAAACAVA